MQAAAGGLPLGVPITELALLNTFTLLLWQLKALQQEDSTSGATSQAVIDPAEGLGERVVTFSVHLESIFEGSEDLQRLQDCIFRIQADLYLVFSYSKLHVSLGLHPCFLPTMSGGSCNLCAPVFAGCSPCICCKSVPAWPWQPCLAIHPCTLSAMNGGSCNWCACFLQPGRAGACKSAG